MGTVDLENEGNSAGTIDTGSVMDLIPRHRKLIWHSFTQAELADPPLAIVKGEGSYLFDEQNHKIFGPDFELVVLSTKLRY